MSSLENGLSSLASPSALPERIPLVTGHETGEQDALLPLAFDFVIGAAWHIVLTVQCLC